MASPKMWENKIDDASPKTLLYRSTIKAGEHEIAFFTPAQLPADVGFQLDLARNITLVFTSGQTPVEFSRANVMLLQEFTINLLEARKLLLSKAPRGAFAWVIGLPAPSGDLLDWDRMAPGGDGLPERQAGSPVPVAIRRLEQLLTTHDFNVGALGGELDVSALAQALTMASAEPDPELNQEGFETVGDSIFEVETWMEVLARSTPATRVHSEVEQSTCNSNLTAAGNSASINLGGYLITDNPRSATSASPFDAARARVHLISDKGIADGVEAIKYLALRRRGLCQESLRASRALSIALKITPPVPFATWDAVRDSLEMMAGPLGGQPKTAEEEAALAQLKVLLDLPEECRLLENELILNALRGGNPPAQACQLLGNQKRFGAKVLQFLETDHHHARYPGCGPGVLTRMHTPDVAIPALCIQAGIESLLCGMSQGEKAALVKYKACLQHAEAMGCAKPWTNLPKAPKGLVGLFKGLLSALCIVTLSESRDFDCLTKFFNTAIRPFIEQHFLFTPNPMIRNMNTVRIHFGCGGCSEGKLEVLKAESSTGATLWKCHLTAHGTILATAIGSKRNDAVKDCVEIAASNIRLGEDYQCSTNCGCI
ncbi:hypothetical protein BOTBODRAFT_148373 [Botryobasidium botryosum FD-172 SS1]|uniref:RNase III domain-containing protein n=1 Tax=Botryobasidium botryosum (strain FD-172 SS1) TaxID=930990 RepID=A0A067MBN7_BOTB1|nr:hypothetical protein BOTBODRAFT_148373 [Botryobasidium botryosum FD-172 SS1]